MSWPNVYNVVHNRDDQNLDGVTLRRMKVTIEGKIRTKIVIGGRLCIRLKIRHLRTLKAIS